MMYKVIDGTIKIPSREQVIERTKVILINDIDQGDNDAKYSIPVSLTEGLYLIDGDGGLKDNHSFYKKTGRYPTIPTAYGLADSLAKSFEVVVYKSDYLTRWGNVERKVAEFDELFEELYTGDLYAGNFENGWVTYNPYKAETTASASIPLRYNTCETLELEYSPYP